MLAEKIFNGAGRQIATNLDELPPLRDGFVRVIHRTGTEEHVNSIVQSGLKSKRGIEYTSDCVDEEDFWRYMLNDPRGNCFGHYKIIMDMPEREYMKVQGLKASCYNKKELKEVADIQLNYGANRLVCPSKYIVGVIDHTEEFCQKCIEFFKKLSRKNQPLAVEKTDLRIFNEGRPVKNRFGLISRQRQNNNIELVNNNRGALLDIKSMENEDW